MGNDSSIDMSKLTQRELLILLNQQVINLTKSLDKVVADNAELRKENGLLRDRLTTVETTYKTWLVVWGVITVAISLLISTIKIIK